MQANPILTAAERQAKEDHAILSILLDDKSHRPWTFEEVKRELDDDPTDGLQRLYGGGLIHKHAGFVWATRAAGMAEEIAQ
jgi:hypothetical protein